MNAIKILHCADIHIGAAESFLGANAVSRRVETLITFEKIINTAKNNQVKLVAIAGDLFDSNKIEDSFVSSVFNAISSAPEIIFIYSAGNHDPLNSDSPFINRELPKNLYVLGTKDECITFDNLNLRVYGRSFEGAYLHGEEYFSIIPPQDDYINLMVLHGELKSDLNSQYNAITPKFIKLSKMDYIALGHVHKRTDIGKIASTSFAYCGCPEGQGFDELDQKGVYLGEIGKDYCNLEFVAVSKRSHIYEKINISSIENSALICEKVISVLQQNYGEDFRNNLYKIELIGTISQNFVINTDELASRLSNEVYFVKIKDNTEFEIDLNSLANEVSLKGIFVKNMLNKINSASPEEAPLFKKALNLGLKAFNSEVMYNED